MPPAHRKLRFVRSELDGRHLDNNLQARSRKLVNETLAWCWHIINIFKRGLRDNWLAQRFPLAVRLVIVLGIVLVSRSHLFPIYFNRGHFGRVRWNPVIAILVAVRRFISAYFIV